MLVHALYRNLIIPGYETVYQGRKTLRYLRQLETSQWKSPSEIEDLQINSLKKLLRHTSEECPYYGEAWRQIGLNIENIQSLSDFRCLPVLNKQTIRLNRESMKAENLRNSLMSKSTGGSTGVPVHFNLNRDSHDRRFAAMIRGYSWAGASLGTKQFYFWGSPTEKRPHWKQWKDNAYHLIQRRKLVNSFELSEASVPSILSRLNNYRPDTIVAYTGAIYQFARLLAERNLRPYSPQSIVVGAEKLFKFQRDLIESVFSAPVFETYGCREVMLIGAECEARQGLHLTQEHLIVEILDDQGRPTPAGEIGNVVVTDLHNYGMPFIRYETGDRARAGFSSCRCGRGLQVLSEVQGRRIDSIKTPDGRIIPGEFFPHLMKDYLQIRQFQIVQPAIDRLEIHVVLSSEWSESLRLHVMAQVSHVLGPKVELHWKQVDSVPLTPAGKQRVVVSQCTELGTAS